jgi:ABC-2 type transport system permease protein
MVALAGGRPALVAGELRKLPAFVRRDFLVAVSYRAAFVSDVVGLVGQALVFAFVSRLVDPSKLPRFAGTEVTYLEFAAVGIALGVFVQFGLQRVAATLRGEQLMGTLESLLVTPTAPATIQLGSVAFDLVYIPVRTAVFLGAIALAFGLHVDAGGVGPAVVVLLAFMPFVWGLGVASAAAVLTFRRGSGLVGLGAMLLAFASGLYFPLDLLPAWIADVASWNPIALAVDAMRQALLGGAGWGEVAPKVAVLAPLGLASLAAGIGLFRLALRRERRRGTVGLY